MHPIQIALIALAGVVAGTANVLAGAGSLLTYPILIAVGLSPLAANVTNDLGIVPGNVSGLLGVREGLRGQRTLLWALVPRAIAGSLIGAALLLLVPASAFGWVAPPLLLAASLLTLGQPAIIRATKSVNLRTEAPLRRVVELTSVYGGYFGTGIGLVFMAALGIFIDETPARLNSLKTMLQLVSNGIAGIVFAFLAPVHWPLAAALAVGSVAGGQLGARAIRHVSPAMLRSIVAIVGILAAIWLLGRQLGI